MLCPAEEPFYVLLNTLEAGYCESVACAVVPVAQRMLLSLGQRRQFRRVDVDRVLATVGFIKFNQSSLLWTFTINLVFQKKQNFF